MTSSCIQHKAGTRTFGVHPDYIDLCPESRPQATALQVLENEINAGNADAENWVALTYEEFVDRSLHSYAWRSFYTALSQLEKRGFVCSQLAHDSKGWPIKRYQLQCEAVSQAIEKASNTTEKTEARRGNSRAVSSSVCADYTCRPLVKSTRGI